MTWGELRRIAKERGARLVRNGSRHDKWQTVDGKVFYLERHWSQEARKGITKSILDILGVKN